MFITFEGIEGAGKSTALKLLSAYFVDNDYEYVLTKEPGGSELGKELRRILLDPKTGKLSSNTELFLYLADRSEHVASLITPALEAGVIVLCDRYVDSTLAYQGFGRGLCVTELKELNKKATNNLVPDLTFLFDLEPEIGLKRARQRNQLENTEHEGRFEAEELAFHKAVRNGFLTLASEEPKRWRVLDATKTPGQLENEIIQHLETAGII
ncbi:dTMP kinase [Desulfovibrio litoralis]|uniref:Thymidylate kinase n=1 Tax=Desulfovibrio litoralis DSM 11393 TaxID=1121455 RepID=A0A1M7T6N9_9BACT|nr:dTMP kinase [Desulfovibrio litoralis]SHN66379.1 thymidylate kinase [Desulfovibrio litoralis DSM 11393]